MTYKVCDYSHRPGFVSYINTDSTSPQDGWTTTVELNYNGDEATLIKTFKTKVQAKEYLDAVKSGHLNDWNKNGWYYKAKGYQKPQWKIYAVPVEQVAQEMALSHSNPLQ